MKPSSRETDWFLGLIIALAFLFSARTGLLQDLERKAYDLGVPASGRSPSDKVAIVEQRIAGLGRPLPFHTASTLINPTYPAPQTETAKGK